MARVNGHAPRVRALVPARGVAFDPVLGWINRPNFEMTWNGGPATFLDDGSRRTRATTAPKDGEQWLLLGCSYTQGFGLADAETFGWHVQSRFPEVALRNFGTAGYSTYQSLLRFRAERDTRPAVVIYGFGDFQGYRDVLSRDWMNTTGNDFPFLPPHIAPTDNGFAERPLEWLPRVPLESRSALVTLAFSAYLDRAVYMPDTGPVKAAQRAVLRLMKHEVEAAGARFLVANLWTMPTERDDWRTFFGREGFDTAECVKPETPFEHPDPDLSRQHAVCISEALGRSQGVLKHLH